ncbi:MAG: Tetrahydromethanopterin:alpha-L-glutamate ligase [Methanosaeta sp. PtaB.Bin039]|nr:MAG: Tetrahydromethanopterin:alpha-L-glutamate ligase [Methanosaeta sp. PtaB.Bin039]
MRAAIAVSDTSDWTAQSLLRAFSARGVAAETLSLDELTARIEDLSFKARATSLENLEILLVRDMGRGAPQDVAFRFELLRTLSEGGCRVINPPEAILRAANKFATSVALQRADVPTPRTTVTSSIYEAKSALHEYGRAVSKPLFGYKGRGIELLTDGDEEAVCRILNKSGLIYLQEFVKTDTPRDIRAFVVGDRVAGAIYRLAPPGGWISNLARGGRPQPCQVSDELERLALASRSAVGAFYCGVDLLESQSGLKVIEVNGTPSAKGIFSALGVDGGDLIVRALLDGP